MTAGPYWNRWQLVAKQSYYLPVSGGEKGPRTWGSGFGHTASLLGVPPGVLRRLREPPSLAPGHLSLGWWVS